MERGGGDEGFDKTQVPAHIAVDEETLESAKEHDQERKGAGDATDRCGQAEKIELHQATQACEDDVDRMGFGIDQTLHVLGAVVHGVKAAEEGISWLQRGPQ